MRRVAGLLFACVTSFSLAAGPLAGQVSVVSPDGRTRVTIEVLEGHLTWRLDRDRRPLVLPSLLGFQFQGEPANADSNPQLRAMFGLPDARLRYQIGRAPGIPGVPAAPGAGGGRLLDQFPAQPAQPSAPQAPRSQ